MTMTKHIKVGDRTRAYTLVELLVAVAILVLMMGFLFEFIIGAQRIWSASEKKANAFDTAQVALDVIETDLHNMRYLDEAGRRLPFYIKKNDNVTVLAFYADYTSSNPGAGSLNVGTYPVIYYYTNNSLYRIALDGNVHFKAELKTSVPRTIHMTNLWYLYGSDKNSNDYFGKFLDFAFENGTAFSESNLDQFDMLGENITSFDVVALFSTNAENTSCNNSISGGYYSQSSPVVMKLQLKVDNNSDKNMESAETTNSFTKVIFL